ncbi:hypothetical protein, partial [Leptospira interrogans]|uniref:hypothetical protein n=1 Tax=Leptospira interrogans TaxID=173 RepID=UPI001F44B7A5
VPETPANIFFFLSFSTFTSILGKKGVYFYVTRSNLSFVVVPTFKEWIVKFRFQLFSESGLLTLLTTRTHTNNTYAHKIEYC